MKYIITYSEPSFAERWLFNGTEWLGFPFEDHVDMVEELANHFTESVVPYPQLPHLLMNELEGPGMHEGIKAIYKL